MNIRPFEPTDLRGVIDVWNAALTRDPMDERRFVTLVLLDPNFQAANLLVAVEDDSTVGFALMMTRQVPFFTQGLEPEKAWMVAFGVHPEYRRRGIARALFEQCFKKLTAEGRKTLDVADYLPGYFMPGVDINAYTDALDMLENKLGFDKTLRLISMGANLASFSISPEVAALEQLRKRHDAVTVSLVTAVDVPEVLSFIAQHFEWDWVRHAREYLHEIFSGSPVPMCFLVARRRGAVVGFCQQRLERFGPFGVQEDFRGLGIGQILLFRCLAEMRAQNVHYSYFMWTEENAARLYTRAGYQKLREFDILRKTF
jgi:mycothiol synthase